MTKVNKIGGIESNPVIENQIWNDRIHNETNKSKQWASAYEDYIKEYKKDMNKIVTTNDKFENPIKKNKYVGLSSVTSLSLAYNNPDVQSFATRYRMNENNNFIFQSTSRNDYKSYPPIDKVESKYAHRKNEDEIFI